MKKSFSVSVTIAIVVAMLLAIIPMGSLLSVSAAGGTGAEGDPFLISTAVELAALAARVNDDTEPAGQYYKLTADIDLSAYGASHNGGAGWTPIGSNGQPFEGHLDGNGKKVTGLYINVPGDQDAGLFGAMSTASVKDLDIQGVNITAGEYLGALVGRTYDCTISNCTATGVIKGELDVGGLVGWVMDETTMTNCRADCTVTGNMYVGGLASSASYGSISNCYATGTVTAEHAVGGLVGWVRHNSIANSYATGAVVGGYEVGGLAGVVGYSIIRDCYATGAVTAGYDVGGLVGYAVRVDISSCYTIGAVSAEDYAGGLVGSASDGNITNCAALNPSVCATFGEGADIGRVLGYAVAAYVDEDDNEVFLETTLSGNIAFAGMLSNDGTTAWDNKGGTKIDGADVTVAALQTASGFPTGMTSGAWTYMAGKLPGLGGTVAMPVHLGGTATHIRGDVTLDDIVDIDDILAVRAHMFGTRDLTGEGLAQALELCVGEPKIIDIDVILTIRGIMFGAK